MKEEYEKSQSFLKKLDTFDRRLHSIIVRVGRLLYGVVTLCLLGASVYYGTTGLQSTVDKEQFAVCGTGFLLLAALPAVCKLFAFLINRVLKKDAAFNPSVMKLPPADTIALEDALHRMAEKTGVLVWDLLLGCLLVSLLFCMLFAAGSTHMLLACIYITTIMAAGHLFFYFLWKKRTFTKKMLRSTSVYIPVEDPDSYAGCVEASLRQGILSYEKELILTQEFILGNAEWDTAYTPVAIPRWRITSFTFFYRKTVQSRYSRTVGILRCHLTGYESKPVDLVVGFSEKANKILRILSYYHIKWTTGDTLYI